MKRSLEKLLGFTLETKDDTKGKVRDFLFDEERWIIRYLESDQGKIIMNKKILIPRLLLDEPEWEKEQFKVHLTKEELKKCPSTKENEPVSRKYEEELGKHLQLSNYWAVAPPITATAAYPPRPILVPDEQVKEEDINTSLRSFDEIKGYKVHASDGHYGEVTDIIIDDEDWQIIYFIIEPKDDDKKRKIMLPIANIKKISYTDQEITANLNSTGLKRVPEYNPVKPIEINFEKEIADFFESNK